MTASLRRADQRHAVIHAPPVRTTPPVHQRLRALQGPVDAANDGGIALPKNPTETSTTTQSIIYASRPAGAPAPESSDDQNQSADQYAAVVGGGLSLRNSEQTNVIPAPRKRVSVQREVSSDLPTIIALWRQRQDLMRAHQRLDLQCQSVVRRYLGGEKAEAAKLWTAIKSGKADADALEAVLMPYRLAMLPLDQSKGALEKRAAKMVVRHPLAAWADGVRGIGPSSLVAILGEAGREPWEYRSVAALWKRMGLAVLDGGRQRRVAGDAAIDHGYNAQRRSVMWNVSGCIIKAQVRKDPSDPDARIALGPEGQLYLDRKAYEVDRGLPPFHAHNRAMRYMIKAVLKGAWIASRAVPS